MSFALAALKYVWFPGGESRPPLHAPVLHLRCAGCGAFWQTRYVKRHRTCLNDNNPEQQLNVSVFIKHEAPMIDAPLSLLSLISSRLCPSECNDDNPCEGLSRHATFENFGMAFLTLFRVSTGDNWNGIMKVRAHAHTPIHQ